MSNCFKGGLLMDKKEELKKLVDTKKLDEARVYVEELLKIEPNNTDYLYYYAFTIPFQNSLIILWRYPFQWVYITSIFSHCKMKMVTCRTSCCTYKT